MEKKRLTGKELLIVASTLFGLFFGAGNIIFPISMGQMAGSNVWIASLGFVLTAVGLPLLGVAAMGISHSAGVQDMSQRVSKGFSYFFTMALYLTIGPFFAIPRTATVSFEVGLTQNVPEHLMTGFLLFYTAIFFGLALLFALKPGKILDIVGRYLNPAFLVLIAIIILWAFLSPITSISEVTPNPVYTDGAFFEGVLRGYDTMDALASLAFGIIIVQSVRKLGIENNNRIGIETVRSGFFAILAMAIIYFCLSALGAQSRGAFPIADNGGIAIAQITDYYFGTFGAILLAVIMFVACLKTAIGLIVACSETFYELFNRRFSMKTWTIVVTLVSFLGSNVGLNNILAYSTPVLMLLYPLAIVLIFLALFNNYILDKRLYQWVIGFTLIPALFDFIKAFPDPIYSFIQGDQLVTFADHVFPFFHYGFGWLIPAIIGLVVGFTWIRFKK